MNTSRLSKKPLAAAALALAASLASGAALADHDDDWRYYDTPRPAARGNAYGNVGKSFARSYQSYDYARVIAVRPIVRYVNVQTPVRECWQETQYREYDYGARSAFRPRAGGAIAGGIIGGVIGHQFGSGGGNDAATLLGTLVGAAIGGDRAARRAHDRNHGQFAYASEAYPVERCEVRYESRGEERIEGYDVTYVYNGRQHTTRTASDPGNTIRVQVQVRPVR